MHFPAFTLPLRLARARGSTLAATMLVVAAIVSFLSIAALITSQFGRYAGRDRGSTEAITACDAALEYAFQQWKAAVSHGGGTIPAAADCGPSNMATLFNGVYGSSSGFASSTGVTCPTTTSITISAVDPNGNPVSVLNAGGVAITSDTPAKITTKTVYGYPGWTGYTYNYKATATVSNTAVRFGATPSVTASRFFQVTRVPLFQAAIFYENKLEIHPGAAMTVTGLVHTNGDLWAQGFSTLLFKSNVSYVGGFHQDADSAVTYGWDGYFQKIFPGDSQQVTWANGQSYSTPVGSTSQLNQVSPIDPFGGAATSNNGLHDIIEVPASGNTSTQIAYNNASLVITVDSSLKNTDAGRYSITTNGTTALTGTDYTNVLAAIGGNTTSNSVATTSSFTDLREASTVTTTNVDMAKLAVATTTKTAGALTPWQKSFAASPVVYIRDKATAASGTRKAVRLVNGRNLGQDVSVVSDGGVYVQGDFNTGGTSPSDVPSNVDTTTNNTASPVASGYTRYSAAVLADAVTILSNNWQDGRSGNTLAGYPYNGDATTGRVATPTTVNTAILAGDVPSNTYAGVASGGAHNFPRFLEAWSGKNFTYYGSLVEAFKSEKYAGEWQTGNVYSWPNRMWNFDVNFIDKPPYGAPGGLLFTRGRYQRIVN